MDGLVPYEILLPRVTITRFQVKRQKINTSFHELTKIANAKLAVVKMLAQFRVKIANVAAPVLGACVSFSCRRRQLCGGLL